MTSSPPPERVTVTEVTRHCSRHRRIVIAPVPLTPPKSPFAFDLIAEAGRLRFLGHQQLLEIQERFREQGLPTIPLRTIQRLTDRFVLYHTATHLESLPRLREALEEFGGYVLVLDGTGAAGKMTLVLTDDDDSGGTGWVLLAAPIAEESVVRVTPHLERLKRGLGPPVTGISDQSAGLRDSFRGVFPGVYLLLCQFHVLRSIGESLAGKRYARFKSEVERSGVKRALRSLVQR
ncbi:MULE transposase, conserved domain protein, partial [mine drainage metagenome]